MQSPPRGGRGLKLLVGRVERHEISRPP